MVPIACRVGTDPSPKTPAGDHALSEACLVLGAARPWDRPRKRRRKQREMLEQRRISKKF
jgi:hypothetical protein